jgi:MFS family permease
MRIPASLAPLTDTRFLLLWTGRTTSMFGDGLVNVALVFAVVSVGGSAADIGAVLGVSMAVRVALVLTGGVLSDWFPRRVVMLGSDLAQALVQFAVAWLLFTHAARLWMLLAASVVYGAAAAVFRPALTGIVPETVSNEQLRQANALIGISQSASRVAGPLMAGIAVATAGVGWAYAADGATFVVSAVCLALLRLPPMPPQPRKRFLADLAIGWQEVKSRRWYWSGLLSHAVCNLALAPFYVLGPLVVGGAPAWGTVSASGAAGALAGAALAARWNPSRPLFVGHLLLALGAVQLLAIAVPAPVAAVSGATALGMLGATYLNTVWATALQRLIPNEKLSRASSYDWLVSLLAMPAGYALGGTAGGTVGYSGVLVTAALVIVVASVPVACLPAVRAVRLAEEVGIDGNVPV